MLVQTSKSMISSSRAHMVSSQPSVKKLLQPSSTQGRQNMFQQWCELSSTLITTTTLVNDVLMLQVSSQSISYSKTGYFLSWYDLIPYKEISYLSSQ